MSAALTARTLGESDYDEWTRLVTASPDGSIYATPTYLDTLCTAAGGRFRIIGVLKGDHLVGGVPLYESASRVGATVGPRLLLYYLGPVLRRSDSKYPSQQTAHGVAILGTLADALQRLGLAKITLKPRHTVGDVRPFLSKGWTSRPAYSYVVPLNDLHWLWNRVEQNLRRLVERNTQQGMSCTEDDDFDSFLRLHKLTMAHHDAELYLQETPFRRWFASLHSAGLCKLFHARRSDGESIAAQVVLVSDHPVAHTVSAALDPLHRNAGAAAFLRWRAFEALARTGKTGNDLTDAALNSVTHFKSQLGGDLVMSHVLETRGTPAWTAASTVERAYTRARRAASAVGHRIVRRAE